MSGELEINSATGVDGGATLTITGEIDLATAQRFRQALHQAASSYSAIEVDPRQVTYFDSAGVDALFTYATRHRVKLTIGNNRTIATVIKVSGLAQVVTIAHGT